MSQLERLIQQLCPEGVEFRPLGEIVRFLNGRAYKQTELLDKGKYKVLRVGNFYTNDNWYYSNLELDENKYCKEGDLLYTWAATLGPQIWTGEKVIFHYHIWKLVFDQTMIDKKFLYYVLSKDTECISNSLTQSTMPHVSMASMSKRSVPVPPLEVQREIVRILDQFTKLTAELTAELTARKKQYEYYRDVLLSINSEQWTTLGNRQLFNFHYGKGNTIPKSDGANPVYGCNGIVGTINTYNCQDVPIVGHIGSAGIVNWGAGKIFVTYNGTICDVIDRNLISTKFLFYFLQSANLPQYVKGSQPFLSVSDFEQVKFPLISIQEQRRIASILDRFDTLCNDLTSGLPAEIEARRKQYEYYRDKLLTFPHKNKKEPHNG